MHCTCLQSIIFSAFVNLLDWYSFMIDYKDYYIITHFFFAVNDWSWLGCGQCEGNCHSAPAWQLDLHFQTHFWLLSDWLSTTSALTLNTAQRHNIERNELMPQENNNNIWTTVLRRDFTQQPLQKIISIWVLLKDFRYTNIKIAIFSFKNIIFEKKVSIKIKQMSLAIGDLFHTICWVWYTVKSNVKCI